MSLTQPTASTANRPQQHIAVLAGRQAPVRGLYSGFRPANTALGRYPLPLPIVVTCRSKADARIVCQLNDEFVDELDGKSHEYIWDMFCASVTLETMLTHVPRFYAFKYGKETGIWIGFDWSEVEEFSRGYVGHSRRFASFREAVLFMLKKGPLASKADPPPSYLASVPPESDSGYEEAPAMESASTAGRRTVTINPFPINRTTSLPTPSSSAAPGILRSARSGTSVAARSSNCGSRSVSPIKRTALSTPKQSRAGSPTKAGSRAGGKTRVKVEDDGPYLPLYRDDSSEDIDPSSPEEDANNGGLNPDELAAELQARLRVDLGRDFLRALLRPVPEQSPDSFGLPPLTLGPRADRLILRRAATDETFVTILRIYAHARSEDEFTRLMGRQLNWPVRDAMRLWERIEVPTVFE